MECSIGIKIDRQHANVEEREMCKLFTYNQAYTFIRRAATSKEEQNDTQRALSCLKFEIQLTFFLKEL